MINKVADQFIKLTRDVPGFLHYDSIGFFRLASKKNSILETLDSLFNSVKDNGGNLLVPVYSYSYTKKELYSIKDTPSDLGNISDYLRQKNSLLRTSDANFSYLSFGSQVPEEFFKPVDYESFGRQSLIAKIFEKDGYLMSVGDKLHQCTEVHYLENLLGVTYRFNKEFKGKIVTHDNKTFDQTITYFCRDLDFANKYNVTVSFERLFIDMDNEGLIEKFNIDDSVQIEAVKYQQIYSFLSKKLERDIFYLMKAL